MTFAFEILRGTFPGTDKFRKKILREGKIHVHIHSFVMPLSTDGKAVNWYQCSHGQRGTVNQYSSYGRCNGLPQSSVKRKLDRYSVVVIKRDATEMLITMSVKESYKMLIDQNSF